MQSGGVLGSGTRCRNTHTVVAGDEQLFRRLVEGQQAAGSGTMASSRGYQGAIVAERVSTCADAARAVRAAAAGSRVVVLLPTGQDWHGLVEDLRHLGQVEVVEPSVTMGGLDADTATLLGFLAEGLSVRDAAAASFLSVRTAQRRLKLLREELGARTTTEVVARLSSACQLGA